MTPQPDKTNQYHKVHIRVDKKIWEALWIIAMKRFGNPGKKLYIIVNEALRKYVEEQLPGYLEAEK